MTAFLGWSYINKVTTGHFTSTTLYGFNMAQNCVRFAERTTPEFIELADIYLQHRDSIINHNGNLSMSIWYAHKDLRNYTGIDNYGDMSELLYRYATVTIKMNPSDYLKQVFISWIDFWKVELNWYKGEFLFPFARPVLRSVYYLQAVPVQIIKLVFILLIPFNIFQSIRKKELTIPLMISILVLTTSVLQALSTYGTNTRYSFPFEILIVISVLSNLVPYLKIRFSNS